MSCNHIMSYHHFVPGTVDKKLCESACAINTQAEGHMMQYWLVLETTDAESHLCTHAVCQWIPVCRMAVNVPTCMQHPMDALVIF